MKIDFKKYKHVPKISSTVILVSFLLPFFVIKCGGTEIASLNGVQMISGTTVGQDTDNPFELGPRIFGILTVLFGLASMIFAFLKLKNSKMIGLVLACLGLASLIALYIDVMSMKPQQTGGRWGATITIGLGFGYYLCLMGNLTNTLFFGLWLKEDKTPPKVDEMEIVDEVDPLT